MDPLVALGDLLYPESSEHFLANIWGKQFHVIKGHPEKFRPLFPWSALNDVLEQHRLDFPRLRLAHEGSSIPPARYSREVPLRRGGHRSELIPQSFAEAVKSGATIVLDAVDELYRPLTQLSESLEFSLHERVQINAYVGFGDTRGFDLHWDDHDVIVLQLEGRKHWQVFGSTRPYPLYRDVEQASPPTGEPLWDGFLEAGDLLYIPRGWWHVAIPLAEPTFHLTCGITKRTGMDVLTWLVERGRMSEVCRQDVPRFASRSELVAYGDRLVKAVFPKPGEDFITDFLAEQDARSEGRPRFAFPAVAYDDVVLKKGIVTLRAPRPIGLTKNSDSVTFRAVGRNWEFDLQASAFLEALIAGREIRVADLIAVSGLTDRDALALIQELHASGLVGVSA